MPPAPLPSLLIVEDEDDLRSMLKLLLAGPDWSIRTAPDLGQARLELHQQIPQLILLDLNLPDGSGYELLQEIRENNLPVQVFIVSAYSSEAEEVKARAAGANRFLAKPVAIEELRSLVRSVLKPG